MVLQPTVKGGWPFSLPKGDCPVWGSDWVNWKIEDGFVSSRGNIFETINCDASDLVSKILTKYHNTINKKGLFPARMVIPATTFTATLSKIGYLEIKANYSRVYIVQASNMKERQEELNIKGDGVTTTLSIPRYPLRSHSLVYIKNHLFIVGIGPICDKEL